MKKSHLIVIIILILRFTLFETYFSKSLNRFVNSSLFLCFSSRQVFNSIKIVLKISDMIPPLVLLGTVSSPCRSGPLLIGAELKYHS